MGPIPPKSWKKKRKTLGGGTSVFDRRKEEREPSEGGQIVVLIKNQARPPIFGRLHDLTSSGFRMIHDSPWLETGSVVEYRHISACGLARVVWQRYNGDQWETGFKTLA